MQQKTPLSERFKRTGEQKRSLFQSAVDFLFGYDFFISYAWKDARSYAVALTEKLRTQGFECFLDSTEFAKGDDWRRTGKRALRKTSKLLLLGSPAALDSEPVLHELEAFQSTNRIILPIDFGGSLRNPAGRSCPLLQKLSPDILSITEPLERLGIGPSENTLKEIRDGFRITRQQQKRLRWFAGAAFAFAIIAAFAGWQWYEAGVARDAAKEEARIAESRRLAAESSSALIKYPQRSLLLAVEAVKLGQSVHGVPVAAAEQSLREALGVIGGRALAISQSPTSAVAISPDNHWLVTGSGDKTARLWDLRAKDPALLPRKPDKPAKQMIIGIDGAFVKGRPPTDRASLEIITGRIEADAEHSKVFAVVRDQDGRAKQHVQAITRQRGRGPETKVRVVSDGEDGMRSIAGKWFNANEQHILDWYHIARRFEAIGKGLIYLPHVEDFEYRLSRHWQHLNRAMWKVWHGNLYGASIALNSF